MTKKITLAIACVALVTGLASADTAHGRGQATGNGTAHGRGVAVGHGQVTGNGVALYRKPNGQIGCKRGQGTVQGNGVAFGRGQVQAHGKVAGKGTAHGHGNAGR